MMDSSLMMRFTPLIETTPEPAPEVILTYDTSCLPPAIPTPEPTPIPPQDENEGLSLITIPPLEGEFLDVEEELTGESQSSVVFLTVDTDIEDTSFPKSQCTDAPNDCSLHGAVKNAKWYYPQQFVIIIPDGTYWLTQSLSIIGNVHLVASNYYQGFRHPGVTIKSLTNNFHLMGIESHGLSDGISHVSFYNIAVEDSSSAYHSLKITNSQVGIYNSRFLNLQYNGSGGAIVWHDNSTGDSDIAIVNTIFENTDGHVGGAIIANDTSGSLALDCVTFTNNEASSRGGAIGTVYFDGTITIRNSNFINNLSNDGGALHLMGGMVTFENTYWSPDYSYTATEPNSIVSTGQGDIDFIGDSASVQNSFNCFVPPPPIECPTIPTNLAGTMSTTQSNIPEICQEPPSEIPVVCQGATPPEANPPQLRAVFRSEPVSGSSVVTVLDYSTELEILGLSIEPINGIWYYVRFQGYMGWVNNINVVGIRNCNHIPFIEYVDGVPTIITFPDPTSDNPDYILPQPPDTWFNNACPQITATTPSTQIQPIRAQCSQFVFYVYWHVFLQVYTRPPRMSDLLGSVYRNELALTASLINFRGMNGREESNAYILSQEVLANHYRSTCTENLTENPPLLNCYIKNGYSLEENLNVMVDRYLAGIEAWYSKDAALRRWYTPNILSSLTLSILEEQSLIEENFGQQAIFTLMPEPLDQREGVLALTGYNVFPTPLGERVPWQWGNYGYSTDSTNPYTYAFTNLDTVFCIKNIIYNDVNSNGQLDVGDSWSDDIFVYITVPNIGKPSVYNGEVTPQWVINFLATGGIPSFTGYKAFACNSIIN